MTTIDWVANRLKDALGFEQTEEIAQYLISIEDDDELVIICYCRKNFSLWLHAPTCHISINDILSMIEGVSSAVSRCN